MQRRIPYLAMRRMATLLLHYMIMNGLSSLKLMRKLTMNLLVLKIATPKKRQDQAYV